MPLRPRTSQPNAFGADAAHLRATQTGTASFRRRFAPQFAEDYFRDLVFGPTVSSIGLGTYLGDNTDDVDRAYESAIAEAVARGINLIDTAINYRGQRSERAVGSAVERLIATGNTTREELVVCTKGGYIPLDRTPPATREEYREYVRREFIDSQILHPDEIVAGGHSLAPRFLRYCLAKSRQNLGLRTIDIYYLHNPEQQLEAVGRPELHRRMRAAFELCEAAVERGDIAAYGCATWEGFRALPESKEHLSLEALVQAAREVAGDAHHFRAVQAPINLAMPQAAVLPTQPVGGRLLTLSDAAAEFGISVIGSAALLQGRLTRELPPEVREQLAGYETDAQRALGFVRSLPGVSSALVGMKNAAHVRENLVAVSRR